MMMRKAPSRPSSSLPSLAPTTPRGSSSTKIVVPERARTMLLFIVCCVGLVTTTAAARLYTNYGWWYAAWLRRSPPPTRRRACLPSTQSTKKKKIGIVALRQQASSVLARYAQTAAFEERALANKAAYASAHGYELVVVDAVADSVRPAPWSKLTALRDALPRFDWLAYVDGDALFADHRPALETIVDDDYDIVLSEDWGGYNTGVFFIKNSSFSSLLLEEMWSAGDFLAKPNTWYSHPFPFEYEQRALHYFASSAVWRRKHELYPSMVPVVDEAKSLSVTRRIKVVPQCAINSYLVRPTLASLFFDRERRKKSRYRRGDFIVHLAGHKGANKAALFEYALNSLVRGKKKKKRGRDEEFGEYVDPELRMALEASQQEARNESLLFELAKLCASKDKRILFVTGAGLSIASGIPAFRSGDDAVWSRHVTDMGTRKMLKKDTLRWFNEFWLPTFESERVRQAKPSEAHVAISKISRLAPLTRVVTQNVDGLHVGRIHGEDGVEDSQLIEAHGRARLYRCVGFWDSSSKDCCDEATATQEWYEVDELLPEDAAALNAPSPRFEGDDRLPTCPKCRSALVAPLALLFDECYDAHFFFEADSWDAWLDDSDAIVFVGTSYAVELTREALKRSKERKIPVFDINLVAPPPTVIRAEALRKNSIVGKAEILLPKLAILVEDLLSKESGVEIFSPPLSAHST